MRNYLCDEELQKKIFKGAQKLYEYVSSTIGPHGHNVLIHLKDKKPISTKDGVTVAKNMILEDEFENLGLQILKEASINTELTSGDGTTTSTVLAFSILKQAQKYIFSGCNSYDLKRGIEKAVEKIVLSLSELSKPIKNKEDIEKIASLSANGDKIIGKIIADAIDSVGKDGSIVVENSNSHNTILTLVEGFQLPSGYISPAFVTDEQRGYVKYDSPLVMVTDYKVDTVDDIMPVLEVAARESRPLVIVADVVEGQALSALIVNTVRGSLKVAAINAPRYGEEKRNILKDLSIVLGATLISRENGLRLRDTKLQHLGNCKNVEMQRYNSTFIDGKGKIEEVEKRILMLKNEIEQTENMDVCKTIQERITRLSSGIAIIRIGGSSEIEVQEKRFRIDDALQSVRSAQEEGMLPGGGAAFLRIVKDLIVDTDNEDEMFGVNIVKKAVQEPFCKILENAKINSEMVMKEILKKEFEVVYDAKERKFVYMNEGIIDPAKVLRCALQNAASVAISLITMNCAIVEK